MLMLDHPEKTARLLATLKAAAPFEVESTERLVKYLRAQDDVMAHQTRHIVSDLSYAGDEGGIVCHMLSSKKRWRRTRRIVDPGPCAAIIALCGSRCRLSKAPSKENKEAEPRELSSPRGQHRGRKAAQNRVCCRGSCTRTEINYLCL
jgi:hypothetical protein